MTLVQFDFGWAEKMCLIHVCDMHDLPEIKECLKLDGYTVLSRREAIELANACSDCYPQLGNRIYCHPVVAEGIRRMYAYIKRLRNTRLYNLDCEGPDTFDIHQTQRALQKKRFQRTYLGA